ncbi:MAG: hypothetical protein A4E49_01806 [Methanosaeta sp. PtaU1.Bin112]|nr:MAG: hypothetical protein A4E49_01806 [Methanosaeta sp. PtaU1.Bin112]
MLILNGKQLSHRDYANSHGNAILREDTILTAQNSAAHYYLLASWEPKPILYDSDIRLHLPKLHRISRLDVFSHALYFC